jgi:hypothetical protein
MKRAEFKRECVDSNALVDPVVALLNARFPSLVRDAVEREFSSDPPIALHASDAPAFKFERRVVQVIAQGVHAAARERAALYVARAIADRLAAGDAEKWRIGQRQLVERAQREFDEYARQHRDQVARRERLARIKKGSLPPPKRSAAAEALSRRIAALRLPSIQ